MRQGDWVLVAIMALLLISGVVLVALHANELAAGLLASGPSLAAGYIAGVKRNGSSGPTVEVVPVSVTDPLPRPPRIPSTDDGEDGGWGEGEE